MDTESTGTKNGQVCQLAYIDLSNGEPEAGNLYFAVNEMSDHATRVHGLTVSAMERLSGGKKFADYADQVRKLLFGKCIVGHSIGCDIRALKDEFVRCNIGFKPARQFCTMTHFTPIMNMRLEGLERPKNPRLSELCDYLNVTANSVSDLCTALYGASGGFHDARYDTCATYLCARAASKAVMVKGLFPKG